MHKPMPLEGRDSEDILTRLEAFRDQDPRYKEGRVWSLVYYIDDYFPYPWAEFVDCTQNTKLGAGFEASFGLEWFLARNFSLLAEYGLTVQHEWYLFKFDYYDCCGIRTTEVDSFANGWHMDGSRIRLGMALHF